ncbi:MAG: hypothetical protein LQ346_002640 [Caloplaca aetnensis]|nr:MAG: hypothetical protein LQ346_002640 [Caloplaca aetnensis]
MYDESVAYVTERSDQMLLSNIALDQLINLTEIHISLLIDYTMAGGLMENARRPKRKLEMPRSTKRIQQ